MAFSLAGQIYLPHEAGWLEEFEEELLHFTGRPDAFDDQVDCLALAVCQMSEMPYSDRFDEPIVIGRRVW